MNSDQYRAVLEKRRLTQGQAAELFGVDDRTGRRWALGEAKIPTAVAILLRGLLSRKIKVKDVRRWRDAGICNVDGNV